MFSNNRPHAHLLRGDAHHSVCPDSDGQAAHSAHHRNGAGRCCRGSVRPEHTGARRLFRAVWQGRTLLYHVSCLARDGHRGRKTQQGALRSVRTAHLRRALHHDIRGMHNGAALFGARLAAAGLHHGFKHVDSLSHRGQIRIAAQAQRNAVGRLVDDIAADGSCVAGCNSGIVRWQYGSDVLAVVCGQVCGLLRAYGAAHSAPGTMVSAPLQRRRDAVHLRNVDALHERSTK